jgi:NAD(P)-dependent dehydrogenase (short-subunit alcohol dehydrogenase family)
MLSQSSDGRDVAAVIRLGCRGRDHEKGHAMSESDDGLQGRVVLVTGAGRGLGRAIAIAAAEAGALVVAGSRTPADLDHLTEEIGAGGGSCTAVPLDVTIDASVESFVASAAARFGRIDGLVNNVGAGLTAPSLEFRTEDLDAAVDLNFRSTFLCSQHVGRVMAAGGGGSIVNISSNFSLAGTYGRAAYGAAKAAVDNLTKSLAVEWATLGIRVNAIAAGIMNTPGFERARRNAPDFVARALTGIPAGRIAEPEEVAALAVFLLSPVCYALTGQVVAVDGGQSATLPGQIPPITVAAR